MACNKDDASESCTTFLWNIENYSCFGYHSFRNISSPNFKKAEYGPVSEGHALEHDLAILAEDGSVLQMSMRKIFNGSLEESIFLLREADLSRDTLRIRCRIRRKGEKP
ncbi:hypothetical protein TNCT_269671 [Trichonephila clavata]|uniref:Uncharacterized protein n=1 Tax=Trichonephila clavata TaxID=2740835 RepID=A0A8X6GIU2_TRICU|nr:hypothetical protein TNCT_269671 [Trichonephila clavata]